MNFRILLSAYFLIVILLFHSSVYAFDENTTVITSIHINNNLIEESNWDNLKISKDETLTINYSVNTNDSETGNILYKVFLNGAMVNPVETNESTISFEDLKPGDYIAKVQGYSFSGWEALPAIIQFSVYEKLNSNKKMEEAFSWMNMTIALFVGVILIVLILLLLKRNRKSIKKNDDSTENIPNVVNPDEITDKRELIKIYNSLKQNHSDLTYSYNSLKDEVKKIQERNKSLRNQIASLQQNVSDLENANLQLTEQKERLTQSKMKLEQLQEKKEKLFAIAVHDIKNPASAIKNYVELLESYDLNAHEQQEIMQYLVSTSSRIVVLAQQMSMVMAVTEPEPELNLERASLKNLIDAVCNQNSAYAKSKEIKIINNSSSQTPEILFDKEKMFEAIDNIVNNAIKYSNKDSIINIKSYFNNEKIFVEIADSGVGLSEDDLKSLFVKGAKLSSKPTAGEESSGLGLWIVKNIIEDHKGKISAKSKLGYGSTFTLELPRK